MLSKHFVAKTGHEDDQDTFQMMKFVENNSKQSNEIEIILGK